MTGGRAAGGPGLALALVALVALVALAAACAGKTPESESAADPAVAAKQEAARKAAEAAAAPDTCPAFASAPAILSGVTPEERTLDYWLAHTGKVADLDEELLDGDDIRRLNASYAVPRDDFYPQHDLLAPVAPVTVARKAAGRIGFIRKKLESGDYVGGDGKPVTLPDWGELPASAVKPELRVALAPVELHCVPVDTDMHVPSPTNHEVDPRIDHNACSALHEQEPLQVMARWPGDMLMVQTRYGFGWADADAVLSPPIPTAQAAAFVHGPFASVTGGALELEAPADPASAMSVPEGTRLPIVAARQHHRGHAATGGNRYLRYATAYGVAVAAAPADRARPVDRPFTRRAVLTEAFRFLGAPYGFGGAGAGIDCSRFLLDVFESFGIEIPRHSGWQAKAGSFSIDFTGVPEEDRLLLLDEAQKRGVVLLQLPGHIMLYLGRNDAGEPMAIHALGEYQKVCDQPDPVNSETTMQVNQLQVSTLGLGRGTSKTALIQRVTRVTVFGPGPGKLLAGAAELRPGAPVEPPKHGCHSRGFYIWATPRYTNAEEAMQILAMTNRTVGPVDIALVAPGGKIVRPPVVRLQGPPHGYLVRVAQPKRGTWKFLLGDGDEVSACRTVRVRPHLPRSIQKMAGKKFKPIEPLPREQVEAARAMAENLPSLPGMTVKPPQMGPPVWQVRNEWSPYWERLYAMFVERLFDYPADQDLTWNGLHLLLRDPEHNILYDYLGLGEDERIKLFPDCAELSYTLRVYFSWKMGLPYAYTRCTRAKPKHPPQCEPADDNLMPRAMLGRDDRDDIGSFVRFATAEVGASVSSSSGRTAPDDELGDYYPVRLTRRSLRPGTIFNDPYGHVLVVAGWKPQGASRYGILMAADAQPDGTVGRRRFWRGSFLWKPDVDSGGAGFKVYRPALYDKTTHLISRETNDNLQKRHTRWTRFDDRVYEGTADQFYRRMEGLINPRPLDAETMMKSLVDALGEETNRRVVSIDVGEKYMKENGFPTVNMPSGKGIFLASGPWEDFSTPSRDLRLLIAIDAVLGFPKEVRATPGRFAVAKADAAKVAGEIAEKLQAELARRTFEYTRSDGSAQTLTLATLVARQKALEMAYNPNDCPELRWGAPEGSPELSTCGRRKPAEQRTEMERVRRWFVTRDRPAN